MCIYFIYNFVIEIILYHILFLVVYKQSYKNNKNI